MNDELARPTTRLATVFPGGSDKDEVIADYLVRRERELVQQTAAIRGMLAPKERELGDVRKAMDTLGIPHGSALGDLMESARVRDPSEISALAASLSGQSGESQPAAEPTPRNALAVALAGSRQAESDFLNANAPGEMTTTELLAMQVKKDIAGFTIKQMILSALKDHFHDGATPTDLRDYMKNAYERDIDRNSISPQLARLREEGAVRQQPHPDGEKWHLTPKARLQEAARAALTGTSIKRRKVT